MAMVVALALASASAQPIATAVDAPAAAAAHGVLELVFRLAAGPFARQFDEDGSRAGAQPELRNPYLEDLAVDFAHAGTGLVLSPNGFFDSGGVFRVRFSPPREGEWSWRARSSVGELHGRAGSFVATRAESAGCVQELLQEL